ncbi:ATP-dependent dethiobiotin synthetase BioD 1 [compost metagenome]
MAERLALPVVLVVGMRLGCLNHALLTAEAITARGLKLAGWAANHVDAEMSVAADNVRALEERIAAPMIARISHARQPDVRAVAAALDVAILG